MASYKNIQNHSKRIMRDCKRIKIIRLKGTYYDLKNFIVKVIDIIRFVALQGYHGRFWHKNVLQGQFHFPGSLIVSYYRTCYNAANRNRFDNITVWLYKGLAKPNVGKMLLKRFEMVVNWQCKYQPLANVMKTFLLT